MRWMGWLIVLVGLGWSVHGGAQRLSEEQELEWARLIVGPEATEDECANCHTLEHEAWQTTRHYATFKDRHRSDEAKEILTNLGERSMKRISTCRQCHYTSRLDDEDRVRAAWGVSCESCHGAGRNWLEVHNRPGGDPNADAMEWGAGAQEAPEARAQRLAAAAAKGMAHPERLYDVAANCFGCHTVPDEHLVNVGKHHPGKPFDLVARSQGEVRHRFLHGTAAAKNPLPEAAELRRLYVVGAAVDLEFSLRNLSRASQAGGDYERAMIERVGAARAKLAAILDTVELPGLAAALGRVPAEVGAAVDPALADGLEEAARAFVEGNDGTALGALDALLPTEYVGTPYQPQ